MSRALRRHLAAGFRLRRAAAPSPPRSSRPSPGLPLAMNWSGGKDACHALHLAWAAGYRPARLLTLVPPDGAMALWHTAKKGLLALQARCLGLPIRFVPVPAARPRPALVRAYRRLAREGTRDLGFGYIAPTEHRDYAHSLAAEAGVRVYDPLCGRAEEEVLKEQLGAGYEIWITSVDARRLDPAWAGKRVDAAFARHLRRAGASPCGEAGEFHTFVTRAPRFRARIALRKTRLVDEGGARHLLVGRAELAPA